MLHHSVVLGSWSPKVLFLLRDACRPPPPPTQASPARGQQRTFQKQQLPCGREQVPAAGPTDFPGTLTLGCLL